MPARRPAPDPDPRRGTDGRPVPVPVVPGYVLEERLGRGGSGEVWRARPRGGGPAVAVKILISGDPAQQDREAALLGELDHPHLVRLIEVVHRELRGGGRQVALVLDLLEGGSLARLLSNRTRLRPGEVVTAIAPVAAALAHAHDRGIIHGDLSPGNIVFTAEGRPVLTDLGVGRVLGQGAADEVTPAYVDPVVARGGATGPASDVFGVAAAAFHALTGVPPWNAAGPAETLEVAARGELPDLALLAPQAPPELLAVVGRGLSPHPHLRGSAAAFALDLRHACRPERIALPRPGVDGALLARTGQAPRTELTHQVRRPAGAHAAPVAPPRCPRIRRALGRWAGARVQPTRVLRRAGAAAAAAVALTGAGWLGVLWGEPGGAHPVPAAQVGTSQSAHRPVTTPAPPPDTSLTPAPDEGSSDPVPDAGSAGPGGGSPTGGGTPELTAPADVAGWRDVLAGLYEHRAAAFADHDPATLGRVYTPASGLLATDAALLATDGRRWEGFTPTLVAVTTATPLTAPGIGQLLRLELVDQIPDYTVREGDGTTHEVTGRGPTQVTMTLQRTGSGWRIADAERLR